VKARAGYLLRKVAKGARNRDYIGFNGKFYTFPYFLTFLLKRYLYEK